MRAKLIRSVALVALDANTEEEMLIGCWVQDNLQDAVDWQRFFDLMADKWYHKRIQPADNDRSMYPMVRNAYKMSQHYGAKHNAMP